MYKKTIKPILDFCLAAFALVLLIPLFLAVAFAIRIESKGPIFFKQDRLGKDGRVFRILKFRSMVHNHGESVGTVVYEDDPKITVVGKYIRKTSIDELPQLINIINGEMSFIGPRPPVTTYPKLYEEYTDLEKIRFTVKPGLSGLVQIRNREINDWSHNIPIDLEYVRNFSFLYDMKLMFQSLFVFFRTDNIYTKKS